ncbi:MAG: hypothetical protein PHV66_02750 [Bacteroidales bacterium]|nr:hypothetical protein [Bacteroidales bacterium]
MKKSALSIIDQMVKDNNPGVQMSTNLVDVRYKIQGAVVGFGVPEELGKHANIELLTGNSEYMFLCFVVSREEMKKYRNNQ